MVKYAEAECATCSVKRPKSEMRQVRVKRLVSVSHGSSSSSGTTYSRSKNRNSSKSSRSTRRNYKIQDVWVCKGCRAPKSDKEGLGFWGWAAGAAVLLVALGSQSGEDATPSVTGDTAQDVDFLSNTEASATANSETDIMESRTSPLDQTNDSQIVFESSPIVQPIQGETREPNESAQESSKSVSPDYDCSAVTEAGRTNLDYLKDIGCESVYEGAIE